MAVFRLQVGSALLVQYNVFVYILHRLRSYAMRWKTGMMH